MSFGQEIVPYLTKNDLSAISSNVTWWYNWGDKPGSTNASTWSHAADMDYVPMAFNGQFNAQNIASGLTESSRYLLTFNEPNFREQGNLTPEQAAAAWPKIEKLADEHHLKIVAPALNYCGGACNQQNPFKWLDQFLAACVDCRVDYLAIHAYVCYGSALTSAYFKPFSRYNKPLWLTEFACLDGSADATSLATQKRFMSEAVALMENDPNIFRYAWFLARSGHASPPLSLLTSTGELTELGHHYLSLPAKCKST